MTKEEIKKIVQTIDAGQKIENDIVIFNVPFEKFSTYVVEKEYPLSEKVQMMLLDAGKKAYYEEYLIGHSLSDTVFKAMLEKDEWYFVQYCLKTCVTHDQKKIIIAHKKALHLIDVMMDNADSETAAWLRLPELDVPFVKMEGVEADKVLARYMRDNLQLSEEAQLALFGKKDPKKWVQYYHQNRYLEGKALEKAKEKKWI